MTDWKQVLCCRGGTVGLGQASQPQEASASPLVEWRLTQMVSGIAFGRILHDVQHSPCPWKGFVGVGPGKGSMLN